MALIQKAFSDIITFSRSSNATRVGPTGVLEYAPHNLLQRSQEFDNAYWTNERSSESANSIAAPDGTITADKIIEDSATGDHGIYRLALSVTNGVTYTWSIYAKKGGRSFIALSAGGGLNTLAWFNLDTGATGTIQSNVSAATIQSVGNGWYRCSVTRTVASTSANFEAYSCQSNGATSYTGDGTSGIYLWGAQLSVGPYALDYTPTTSAAVYGPRFDYDGSGVTIVEPVSTNLVTYSEQFDNAAWSIGFPPGATVTANAAISPDGTLTADEVAFTATNGKLFRTSGALVTVSANTAYTHSVWLRAKTGTFKLKIARTNGATWATASVSSEITLTTEWQRVTLTYTSGASDTLSDFVIGSEDKTPYTLPSLGSVYVWGAQVEVGSTATAYMVSGATNGFRAVPVVSGSATPKGLLIEEQRTNLLTYSEQFNNAAWSKVASGGGVAPVVTANSSTSPDGTVNADQVVFVAASSGDESFLDASFSVTSGTAYSFSSWVKAASSSDVGKQLLIRHAGGASYTTATLSLSWQRITVTETSGVTGTATVAIGLRPAVAGSSGTVTALIWGAQLEAGSFATSYIPTLASSVTRSADVASVNTLSPWYNATEGTLFAEAVGLQGQYPHLASPETDSSNAMWAYTQEASSTTRTGNFDVVNGGAVQAGIVTSQASSAMVRLATAYKLNDFAVCLNGGTVATDTSATVPASNKLQIGSRLALNYWANGCIRRIAFYPRRLTNAELQALTA